MGKRLKKIKKIKNIHIHHEGTRALVRSAILFLIILALLYYFLPWGEVFYAALFIFVVVYCIMLNFFQCPIRRFGYDTLGVVVAPADGRIVVLEEVEENEYFHDRRLMVSIFMSLFNVHANWVPLDGTVKKVIHHKGNFHRAWLPKASEENERSTIIITAPNGTEVLVRQVAGAMARRIVTYVQPEEDCCIDEHLGFIKFGSRVDLFLPLGTPVDVTVGQRTVGNETVIARLENEMTETEEREE